MKHLIAAIILVFRLISVTVNALQQSSFGENNKYWHFTSSQFNAYFFTSEKQPYLNFVGNWHHQWNLVHSFNAKKILAQISDSVHDLSIPTILHSSAIS
jgi:hypothetical protein